jgi:ribokinase
LSQGVKSVVITLGAHGVVYQTFIHQQTGLDYCHVPARKVKVVDTTAAGDTFVGAYAVAWAASASTKQSFNARVDFAVNKANEAASLTVQRNGAQSAIPWMDEVVGGLILV